MRIALITITALLAALLAGAAPAAAPAATGAASACTPTPPPADPTLPAPTPAVVGYPASSSTGVTKTTATLRATVDTAGLDGTVAFELGDAATGLRCTAPQLLPALAGPRLVTATLLSEKPGTTVHFRVVLTTAAGQVVGADQLFTTIAAPARLAAGTTLLGVRVGYLSPAAAQAKVLKRFARPVVFTFHGKRWQVRPGQLGATADIPGAIARALAGTGSAAKAVPVAITVDQARVAHYVSYLDGLFSREARTGSVKRVGRRAEVIEPQSALAVQTKRMQAIITNTLESPVRRPIEVLVTETKPTGPGQLFIVVRLGEQSLTLYKDGAVVLQTPVTTGRPALPTPVGSYDIAWRRSPYTFISPWPQGSPYYYPPAHVTWAMYFFDNDFLHDSYEPSYAYGKGSNLGPYASHGCVHVPHDVMQVLYTTVPDHTPLIVVDA
jgi:lipoprotein-anchoring transpeptidase ErfK/SrfK